MLIVEPTVTLVIDPAVPEVPILMVWVFPFPATVPILIVFVAVDCPIVIVPVPVVEPKVKP